MEEKILEKKPRKHLTMDETVVKANVENYYTYAVIDIEKNKLVVRVNLSRNYLTTKPFITEVLKYYENKPKFIVDKSS